MFLFCLLLAYVILRVSEDVTAAVRHEVPPRQKIREAKLAARERTGGRAPQSSFGRYVGGLLDDAWDSAHHRRQLMADHRQEKQARRLAAKQERDRRRWARKDAQRGGAGFDAQVPTPGENAPIQDTDQPDQPSQPDPQPAEQPGRPAPIGFYAPVPAPSRPTSSSSTPSRPTPQPAGQADRPARRDSYDDVRTLGQQPPSTGGPVLTKYSDLGPQQREILARFVHIDPDKNTEQPKEDSSPTDTAPTPLPNNVIPFKRSNVTTQRMELPVTNPEITGLDSAITYAQGMAAQCTHAYDQISAILPTGDETAASCEQARADLETGGVSGQPLTDVSTVQEQMTGAITELQAALTQLEAAAAAANSLASELQQDRTVQEAYTARPDAGDKKFVTAE